MLKSSRCENPVNLSGGIGDSSTFPLEEFRKIIQAVLRRDGNSALEYGDREGYAQLRNTIAQVLTSEGIQTSAESILITSGSQQGLALAAQLLVNHGDTILVEDPTYTGALSLFRNLRLKMVGIPVDEQGMQVEKLEKLLQQHHPRLIYTIPNFHNPTGTCLSLPRRHQLITLADRYNVPILEDDYVGDLRYEGRSQPALKALDPGGRVIYASTFSKMLMPGIRVGFLAVDGPIFERLARLKFDTDLATSGLIQRAVESFVTIGRYQAHLRRTCQVYRKRRDVMLKMVRQFLPSTLDVSQPQGGLFIWAHLPEGVTSDELLPLACEEGVAFHPGSRFFLNGAEGKQYMRLNFAAQTPDVIEEGIRRLGRAIERFGRGT
jgi:GntR family transcriptional regulator/MocR family aminotransferase